MTKKWLCTIYARRKGAQGIWSTFHDIVVEAKTAEDAHLKLYDDYEHIHNWKIEEVKDE